jgi:RimJ/RimL family protein N-acetyltransferase
MSGSNLWWRRIIAMIYLLPLPPTAKTGSGIICPMAHLHLRQIWRHGWRTHAARRIPYFFAIIDQASNRAIGVASYLRINPQSGSIEVGHINFAPVLQGTIGATEAMYMMMRWAFDAGYRRYEWKCNALNMKSRRAAQRLGLSYEGVFRQATCLKGAQP